MATERGILRSLMYKALDAAYSFNAFYRSASEKGISYRRSDMLADWRSIQSELANRAALRSLSAGDIPEHTAVGASPFKYTEPFIYKARVEYQISAEAPLMEQFVTVLSSKALTIGGAVGQVLEKWPGFAYGKAERIRTVEIVAAMYMPQ